MQILKSRLINLLIGGRFKKEVIIDGQSYLLLIRDEGGSPEMQVCIIINTIVNTKKLLRMNGRLFEKRMLFIPYFFV